MKWILTWGKDLIPAPYRVMALVIAVAILISAVFTCGWKASTFIWEGKLDKMVLAQTKKANADLLASQIRVASLTRELSRIDGTHADRLHQASENYQKELTHVQDSKDRFVAGVRSGAIVLRLPAARTEQAGGHIPADALAPASRCDGEARGELSAEVTEFLYSEASRADDTVNQLTAAQAVALAQYETCRSALAVMGGQQEEGNPP